MLLSGRELRPRVEIGLPLAGRVQLLPNAVIAEVGSGPDFTGNPTSDASKTQSMLIRS